MTKYSINFALSDNIGTKQLSKDGYIYSLKKTPIEYVKPGMVLLVDGVHRTVCANNIKRSSFMGRSVFGCAYPIVDEVVIYKATKGGWKIAG